MADFALGAAIWQSGRSKRVVFDSGPFAVVCDNMTSSAKPEVHNALHCLEQATAKENLVKFGRAVFEICERTDGQTDRQRNTQNADHSVSPSYPDRSNKVSP